MSSVRIRSAAVFGHVGSRDAHGDAHVGGLQGGSVVDAVAGHSDDFPVRLQGLYNADLMLRGDLGEDGEAAGRSGELPVGEGVDLRAAHTVGGLCRDAKLPGDDEGRIASVPRDHDCLDARRPEILYGLYRLRADGVDHAGEAHESQTLFRGPVVPGPGGEGQKAQGTA